MVRQCKLGQGFLIVGARANLFNGNMKDNLVSSGEDAAWVDFISFPPPLVTSGGAGTMLEICETETHQLEVMPITLTHLNGQATAQAHLMTHIS